MPLLPPDEDMNEEFPSAVPEIPVADMRRATSYYENCLGFERQPPGGDGGGEFNQLCRGSCRLFLTGGFFRSHYGHTHSPVVIWLNVNNKKEVDELYEAWNSRGARIVSKPESKPWHLHEFTAADPDGNLLRVFYDFAWELRERGEL
jgi:uncharacterized glyoxalase superfamily protein PhnB